MDTHLAVAADDEDYINMELISSPSTKSKEFEFQYFSTSNHNIADDLFYKGTLLPLHLTPAPAAAPFDRFLTCSTAPCTNSNTPLDSCNISPSQSCRVSCELNPNDPLFQWPSEFTSFFNNQPRNHSWSKRLKMKLNQHLLLAKKLKSSRAYLKSLFTKSAACSQEETNYFKLVKKVASLIKKTPSDDHSPHRRSFSTTNSSSSSTSFNSSGLHELQVSRRSSNAAEIEVSIDAAIAHCKKSSGICSLSSPKYVP